LVLVVVLHAARLARRGRARGPGVGASGPVPRSEYQRALPPLSGRLDPERLARGRHDQRHGAADEPGWRARDVGYQSLVSAPLPPPGFYASRPDVVGHRRVLGDWWTILHPPYTAWHLSYVVLGAALAPVVDGGVLFATVVAFFAAVGVSAHALDEL